MSYPAVVPNTFTGWDMGYNSARGQYGFQFVTGTTTAQYLFVHQGGAGTPTGDFKVHALRSTDGGQTWVEQNSGGVYAVPGDNVVDSAYTVVVDGTTVQFLACRGTYVSGTGTMSNIVLGTFNLTSNTWGGSSTSTAIVPDFVYKNQASGIRDSFVQLIKRGAGDYILYFSGPHVGTVGTAASSRPYYATYNGSTFGTATAIPVQSTNTGSFYAPLGGVADNLGNTHYFYSDSINGSLGANIWHIAMNSGGTFGTASAIASGDFFQSAGAQSGEIGGVSDPIVYTAAGTQTLGIVAPVAITGSGNNINATLQYISAPVALNPTFSVSTINPGGVAVCRGVNIIEHGASVAYDGTTNNLAVTWKINENNFWEDSLYVVSTAVATSLTWATPSGLFFDPANYQNQWLYSYPMAGGVGVFGAGFYNGAGTFVSGEYAQFTQLVPGGGTTTTTVTNTTTTTTTTTATSTGISAVSANFKLFDHTNAARPEPPRVLTFDSDRVTSGEVWFREIRSDLNAYNGTITGVVYVDENIISTFSCVGLVGGTGGTGRTVYPNPFPVETYGKAIYVRYSSTTPFKHYRTWYESEIQPDRMNFWESSYETTPSVGVIKTWLTELNALGASVLGTLYVDGVAVMTSTFMGTTRRIHEIGLPNITTGKTIKAVYNAITPANNFKWWNTHYEIDAKPFLKNTWNVIYRKIGGATQLDMARFWEFDVEVPAAAGGTLSGTSTITSTWQVDGTAFLTNTYTLTNTRTYIDRISFPPGVHGYLFQQQISADQPFHLWKSNMELEHIGVKGFTRLTLPGTPLEEQNVQTPQYPKQIKPWSANYQ